MWPIIRCVYPVLETTKKKSCGETKLDMNDSPALFYMFDFFFFFKQLVLAQRGRESCDARICGKSQDGGCVCVCAEASMEWGKDCTKG